MLHNLCSMTHLMSTFGLVQYTDNLYTGQNKSIVIKMGPAETYNLLPQKLWAIFLHQN
jgi:hypothetical protein